MKNETVKAWKCVHRHVVRQDNNNSMWAQENSSYFFLCIHQFILNKYVETVEHIYNKFPFYIIEKKFDF